jgi:hypothetical protein
MAGTSDLERQLMEVERGLWTNDPDLYHESLTDGALLLFQETGLITRDVAVDAIRTENAEDRKWADVQFENARALAIAAGAALLTYKVTARWNYEESGSTAWGTTTYVRRGGRWKVAFHQQTPAA